jgi:hypothetical protein
MHQLRLEVQQTNRLDQMFAEGKGRPQDAFYDMNLKRAQVIERKLTSGEVVVVLDREQ